MSSKDVERSTTFANQVFAAAEHVIETMQDGERIQIKQLAQTVGLALAKDPKDVLGFVNHFAHDNSLSYVTRGKNGGIIRGTKPAKVVKASKKTKDTVVASTTDAADASANS
jgi:hypothetical protein